MFVGILQVAIERANKTLRIFSCGIFFEKNQWGLLYMSQINELYSRISGIIKDIADNVDPYKIPEMPELLTLGDKLNEGRNIRDFMKNFQEYVSGIIEDKKIQEETRGLSGTKNEILRDLIVGLQRDLGLLEDAFRDYINEYISGLSDEKITQTEINKMLDKEPLVISGNVDQVSLFKLRKFVYENRDSNYVDYIRLQKNNLDPVLFSLKVPLDRYGIIQKSIVYSLLGISDPNYEKLRDLLRPERYDKNVIIIYRQGPGYYFKSYEPKNGDVSFPISEDFIRRTQTVIKESGPDKNIGGMKEEFGHIICLPNPGKLTSLYETYDFKKFFYMTSGLSDNLVPYSNAVGYFSAQFESDLSGPIISHEVFNKNANKIFASNFYRYDIALMANDFKFGQGMADAIKSRIKDYLLEDIDKMDAKDINIPSVIRKAVNNALPEDMTRESSISSYLGIIRLTNEFNKEYQEIVKKINWDSHKRIGMTDVFNKCVTRCDKIGAWTIDHKSPKDLFFK